MRFAIREWPEQGSGSEKGAWDDTAWWWFRLIKQRMTRRGNVVSLTKTDNTTWKGWHWDAQVRLVHVKTETPGGTSIWVVGGIWAVAWARQHPPSTQCHRQKCRHLYICPSLSNYTFKLHLINNIICTLENVVS